MARPDLLPPDLQALMLLVVNAPQAEDVLFGTSGVIPRLAVGTVVLISVTLVPEAARALTFPLPLAAAAHHLFLAAAASGHAARDDAFVIRVWQALTGIALPAKH